ncbi:hypothetical protein BZA05DRAFT_396104 [Tricharina praecox]|uniref:uncharacterized protein n=1 Tax=Tricharina praecox TaxID=43433 RepID=UPI002220EF5F|nr:uncharacterized protein BZA05DRAFT_396104 [Tricharina praecox]KAI5853451.1 hypothetical protein BZA05DRAFT_396104 [Tricharina praecox]
MVPQAWSWDGEVRRLCRYGHVPSLKPVLVVVSGVWSQPASRKYFDTLWVVVNGHRSSWAWKWHATRERSHRLPVDNQHTWSLWYMPHTRGTLAQVPRYPPVATTTPSRVLHSTSLLSVKLESLPPSFFFPFSAFLFSLLSVFVHHRTRAAVQMPGDLSTRQRAHVW